MVGLKDWVGRQPRFVVFGVSLPVIAAVQFLASVIAGVGWSWEAGSSSGAAASFSSITLGSRFMLLSAGQIVRVHCDATITKGAARIYLGRLFSGPGPDNDIHIVETGPVDATFVAPSVGLYELATTTSNMVGNRVVRPSRVDGGVFDYSLKLKWRAGWWDSILD